MTTPLTIYRFGLRGNSANESIGKHRFRTKKHSKVNKSGQKMMAYLFGTMRSRVRITFLRPHKNNPNTLLLGESFGLFFMEFMNINRKSSSVAPFQARETDAYNCFCIKYSFRSRPSFNWKALGRSPTTLKPYFS